MSTALISLASTALLMGLAGGTHCVAMCGAACAGIGQAAGAAQGRALLAFQAGRVLGYAGLGALAAASMQGLGWLTVQSVALRPLWTFLHLAAIALGLLLLWRAQQPPWVEALGRFLWVRARALGVRNGAAPALLGILWALLPCGLLYSAVMVSALAGSVAGGALLMALFALGSGITLWAGPRLWLRWAARREVPTLRGDWGVRLAGAALAASAAGALWMDLVHDTAPWCVVA